MLSKPSTCAGRKNPAFNAVYVSGERAGVVAQVKRSGTAGDVPTTMVVDPLITHADAARSRGIAILSDTGKQALVTLELPMLPELGLLSPGLMLSIGAGSCPLAPAALHGADWCARRKYRRSGAKRSPCTRASNWNVISCRTPLCPASGSNLPTCCQIHRA